MSTEQILSLLLAAPRRIAAAVDGVEPAWLQTPPGPGEWSARDVLAHLRACADVWGGCIEAILTQDTPTLRAINPRTWIDRTNYLDQGFQPSLEEYLRLRSGLLALLEPLPPENWARSATLTGAGRPLVRTVRYYAQRLATHERPHVRQIERAVSSAHLSC